MSFQAYQEALAKKDAAYQGYNAASLRFELANIRCRLAEILSQHEPLGTLEAGSLDAKVREKMYAAAFYVVVGKMP